MDDNKLQRMEVLRIMGDGQWRTLMQLSSALGQRYLTTSLSARLRDFRKQRYGGYRVERRLVLGSDRLYEYRVLPPRSNQDAMPASQPKLEQKRTLQTLNLFSEATR